MKKRNQLVIGLLFLGLMVFNARIQKQVNPRTNLADIIQISSANAESYGSYMHQGWCPSGWLSYGTYCNETYSATNCSNPTC